MVRYFRLSIKGSLGAQEVWSVNPVLDPSNEVDFDWNQTAGDASALAIASIVPPEPLLVSMSSACRITGFRVELRDTAQAGFLGASEYTRPAPFQGTGLATKPPQSSIVASLRTASALASGRGRLYWPALGVNMDPTSLRLTAQTAKTLSDSFSSYLTDIANALRTSWDAVPWVGVGVSVYSPTSKILTPVNRIQVGDVIDVQRRRRDRMPETYQITAYPTP